MHSLKHTYPQSDTHTHTHTRIHYIRSSLLPITNVYIRNNYRHYKDTAQEHFKHINRKIEWIEDWRLFQSEGALYLNENLPIFLFLFKF